VLSVQALGSSARAPGEAVAVRVDHGKAWLLP
jgi:hypothetical protein